MWEVSNSWREALAGSREMTARAVITRDGDELTADGGIEPTSWRIVSSLSGAQVQSKLDLVITDPDGDMLTEDPLSPLQVYGQRVSLDVTVAVGEWSESLPMGIWRLNSSQPSGGPWRYYAGTWVRPAQRDHLQHGPHLGRFRRRAAGHESGFRRTGPQGFQIHFRHRWKGSPVCRLRRMLDASRRSGPGSCHHERRHHHERDPVLLRQLGAH